MKVRIGIDVGGTFTDAVAIDNETFEVVGSVKVPTTHTAAEGVAAGIVQVLHKVMEQCEIRPEDVIFIAHGTTQATNALLEGDVAPVGIITLGSGLQGAKSKGDTTMGDIELSEGKYLRSCGHQCTGSGRQHPRGYPEAAGAGGTDLCCRRGLQRGRPEEREPGGRDLR